MDQNDEFAFIKELCVISSSQEEYLRSCPFVGEAENVSVKPHDNGEKSPQRVSHAPPTPDFDNHSLNQSVNLDDDNDADGFSDLCENLDILKNPELGLTDVAGCSLGLNEAQGSEFSVTDLNKFRFLETSLSLKDGLVQGNLGGNILGFDTSKVCLDTPFQKVCGKESPTNFRVVQPVIAGNDGNCEADKSSCTGMGEKQPGRDGQ